MPSHLATPIRRRRAGALAIALGVGLIGFTLVDEDPRPEVRTSSDGVVPADTSPTVLGAVVTRDSVVTAEPAAPATFEIDDDDDRTATTRRRPTSPSTAKSAPTTFPPPTLGPPWSIVREPEDTTTTVEDTTTSSTTTDTTEGTTSTTDTTEAP